MRGILGGAIVPVLPVLLGATTCVMPRPCRLLQSGGVAFIGDIVSAEKAEPEYFGYLRRHKVRIVEAIYGIPPGQTSLDVFSYYDGESEGLWKPGRYLFAGAPRERGLTLGFCDAPKPVIEAAADIRYLKDSLRNRSYSSLELRLLVTGGPAAGALVTVDSDKQRFQHRVTDPKEKILFERLEPGRHKISVHLPGFERESGAAEIEVPPGACLTEYSKLVPGNSLRGTVADLNGKPLAGVPVSYRYRGSQPDSWRRAVKTSADGTFEIRGISPGRYDLAACAGLVDEPPACAPSALGSNPVSINVGSHVTDLRLTAGPALTLRTLRIRLDRDELFMGNLLNFHAATPEWIQKRRMWGRGNSFQYQIPKELTTRLQLMPPFRKEIVIPPGENDVEIKLP